MEIVQTRSVRDRVRKVRSLINGAGNQIFAVTFTKRSDGEKRKMACRLHVHKPTYAGKPSRGKNRKEIDRDNKQITVFDVNKINYNKKDLMNGRGTWRTISLETVERICVNGTKYKIVL